MKGRCTGCGTKDQELQKMLCLSCYKDFMREETLTTSIPQYECRPELSELIEKGRSNWTEKDWHWFRTSGSGHIGRKG